MKKLLLEVEVTPRGIGVETSLPPGWDLPLQPRPRGKEEAWGLMHGVNAGGGQERAPSLPPGRTQGFWEL